jgi:hypothetical protein
MKRFTRKLIVSEFQAVERGARSLHRFAPRALRSALVVLEVL